MIPHRSFHLHSLPLLLLFLPFPFSLTILFQSYLLLLYLALSTLNQVDAEDIVPHLVVHPFLYPLILTAGYRVVGLLQPKQDCVDELISNFFRFLCAFFVFNMFYEKLQVVEEEVLIKGVGVEVFLQDKLGIGDVPKVFNIKFHILNEDEGDYLDVGRKACQDGHVQGPNIVDLL